MSDQNFYYNYSCKCDGCDDKKCEGPMSKIEHLIEQLVHESKKQTKLLELSNALLVELLDLEAEEYGEYGIIVDSAEEKK